MIRLLTIFVLCFFAVAPVMSQQLPKLFGEYNTDQIVGASFLPKCVDYCIEGYCLKMVCNPVCSVEVVPLVEHNLPDLIVDIHPEPGKYAYSEDLVMGEIAEASLKAYQLLFGLPIKPDSSNMVDGSRRKNPDKGTKTIGKDHDIINKSVGVFGNPMITVWNQLAMTGVGDKTLCSSEVQPFEPYYLSESDTFNWRFGLPDFLLPETYKIGFHEVGGFHVVNSPLKENWGSVYPRQMSVVQQVEPKAAAVLAQRAVNITTYGGGVRVVNKAPLFEENQVIERDEYENWWGMLSPVTDNQCGAFGTTAYDFGRSTVDHKYSFVYWARHWCCPGSGVTIARVRADPICFDLDVADSVKDLIEDAVGK